MSYTYAPMPMIAAIILLLCMLLFQEIGRRIGIRRISKNPKKVGATSTGMMESAIFALFGLLVAFTFSGAATRFDDRRLLIAEEANAIGTAYLRLDMIAPEARSELRELFRQYLDSRLEVYKKLPDLEAAKKEWAAGVVLQNEIWSRAVAACTMQAHPGTCVVLLPAMNEMIDITTTQKMFTMMHPPWIIFMLLVSFALGCSFVGGYGMAKSDQSEWTSQHILFAAMVAATVYVIFDIEYPRFGLIRIDAADQVLIELRESMQYKGPLFSPHKQLIQIN